MADFILKHACQRLWNRYDILHMRTNTSKRSFTATFAIIGLATFGYFQNHAAAVEPAASGSASPITAAPQSKIKFSDRATLEVVRNKKINNTSGYYDSKDQIELKIKLANTDVKIPFENLKGEIYIFAGSISNPNILKMLGSEKFDFSLPARGNYEFVTKEVVTTYDKTNYGGARSANDTHYHGFRYTGWLVRIRDASGAILLDKSTTPILLRLANKAADLKVNQEFNKNTIE